MNWLTIFDPFQYDRVISIISSYEQNLATLDDTIDRLDYTLDIWNLPPEAWADTDIIKWAGIFNIIEASRHAGRALSVAEYEELTATLTSLKAQARKTYCIVSYTAALHDIAEYEQGRLPIDKLANRTFWRLVYNLEEYISDSTYKLLQDKAAGLEMTYGRAYEWQKRKPTKEQLKQIEVEVAEGKALLIWLISKLDLE